MCPHTHITSVLGGSSLASRRYRGVVNRLCAGDVGETADGDGREVKIRNQDEK